jgi:alkylation response protein AidB-like acyl-CoA dehydrogenase
MQAEARRFAMQEVMPVANECDPQKREIPRKLIGRLGAQVYFGIMIGCEYGGMGCGVFEYCMICEELARALMSVASIIGRAQGMGTGFDHQDKRRKLRADSL